MILGTSRAVRVFAYPRTRRSPAGYDGLYGLVQTRLGRDPLNGELFLFVNQWRKLCKVLLWDGTGLCSFQKRLEKGRSRDVMRRDRGLDVDLAREQDIEELRRIASMDAEIVAVPSKTCGSRSRRDR